MSDKLVWKMTKRELVAERTALLGARGERMVYPTDGGLSWSKTELENDVASMRAEEAGRRAAAL